MAKHTTHSGDDSIKSNQPAAAEDIFHTHSENPVFQEHSEALKALLEPGMVDLQIGFPPYWKPDLGKAFKGQIMYRDERDPTFPRYYVKNAGPTLMCHKGKSDENAPPTEAVRTGQIFSIGAFKGLPLDRFFGLDAVVVAVTGSRKLPVNKASLARGINIERDFWEWQAFGSKESERILASKDRIDMEFRLAAVQNAQRAALQEIARLDAEAKLKPPAPALSRPANGANAQLET